MRRGDKHMKKSANRKTVLNRWCTSVCISEWTKRKREGVTVIDWESGRRSSRQAALPRGFCRSEIGKTEKPYPFNTLEVKTDVSHPISADIAVVGGAEVEGGEVGGTEIWMSAYVWVNLHPKWFSLFSAPLIHNVNLKLLLNICWRTWGECNICCDPLQRCLHTIKFTVELHLKQELLDLRGLLF